MAKKKTNTTRKKRSVTMRNGAKIEFNGTDEKYAAASDSRAGYAGQLDSSPLREVEPAQAAYGLAVDFTVEGKLAELVSATNVTARALETHTRNTRDLTSLLERYTYRKI